MLMQKPYARSKLWEGYWSSGSPHLLKHTSHERFSAFECAADYFSGTVNFKRCQASCKMENTTSETRLTFSTKAFTPILEYV